MWNVEWQGLNAKRSDLAKFVEGGIVGSLINEDIAG